MTGTIWTELDETKLYQTMDLVEIDKLFSAYQKNGLLVSFATYSRNNMFVRTSLGAFYIKDFVLYFTMITSVITNVIP